MGAKIIANETNKRWGYRKGDVLEIVDNLDCGYVSARNLTNKHQFGRKFPAILARREFSYAKDAPSLVAEYRLFGIPILRKYTKEAAE